MTPQHVISQLLESDTEYPKNLELLKKIILTTYLGRLRINNQSPDDKIPLANYIFDTENMIFDYTRISEEKKQLFLEWLLGPHQENKETTYIHSAELTEYRGFTAEVGLSIWGIIKRWFDYKITEKWKIFDLSLSLNYQLTGIEMQHGKQGTLIGFEQFFVPPSGGKYKDPNELQHDHLRNTKRVFITDRLIDQLMRMKLSDIQFGPVCKNPHPHAIEVNNEQARFTEMHNYRVMQKFHDITPWYFRLWDWIKSFWDKATIPQKVKSKENRLECLTKTDTIKIYQRTETQEVVVQEKRPIIDNIVYCGGGAKIFAHVGVWKALNEVGIKPKKFAGSSAGAIMALFCYLGCSAEEITELFNKLKHDHVVYFDISSKGLSDSRSLKTFLDYVVAYKLKQITTKYKIPYPAGKITFATLEAIRQKCPGCGLGDEIIVTATNKTRQVTRYYSLSKSPDAEVTEAVKRSASFPVLFKPTVDDGEEYNDGGILSNFPTEAFSDDKSTFLESEYGNNLKVLAIQFDNGTERTAVDRIMERVYRENFFLNWIYRLITGIQDPASGWEQDRLKLRKYAAQSLVIDVADVSSSSFLIDDQARQKIVENGYQEALNYLRLRYSSNEKQQLSNNEMMYSTFNSLGDLLSYCCYRGNKHMFDTVKDLILNSNSSNKANLIAQALKLEGLYFRTQMLHESTAQKEESNQGFFGHSPMQMTNSESHNILLALYPVFLKIVPEFLKTSEDKKLLEQARHSLNIDSPLVCLEHLSKIKNQSHVLLHIFINLLKALKTQTSEEIYSAIKSMQDLLNKNLDLTSSTYYSRWNLSFSQSIRVLNLFKSNQLDKVQQLCQSLAKLKEPMQIVQEGVYYDDDYDYGGLQGDRQGLGI